MDISHARLKDVARYVFEIHRHNLPFYFAYFLSLESHRELVGEAVSKVVRVKLCSVQVILIFDVVIMDLFLILILLRVCTCL